MAVRHDLPRERALGRKVSARAQVLVAAAVGVPVAVVTAALTTPALGVLVGWDATALVFVGRLWPTLWRMDAERTAEWAVRADPTRATADAMLLSASVASLLAVGFVLVSAANSKGTTQSALVALGLLSIVVSWAVVHTVFALRYAAEYYTGSDGGVNFNGDEPPDSATSPTSR